jgi:hypothetical protein
VRNNNDNNKINKFKVINLQNKVNKFTAVINLRGVFISNTMMTEVRLVFSLYKIN